MERVAGPVAFFAVDAGCPRSHRAVADVDRESSGGAHVRDPVGAAATVPEVERPGRAAGHEPQRNGVWAAAAPAGGRDACLPGAHGDPLHRRATLARTR